MSCASPRPGRAPAATPLAPGFRFHPTDEELVSYYLKRKASGRPFRVDAISEIDLYRSEPWDLPSKSRIQTRDTEWYFFSALDKKYANRSRTNRATGSGYWKTTGKDRAVCRGGRTVGMKKTLVFHVGRAPKGERTNWVMHEYRLEDEELARGAVPQDAFVVCRVFLKKGPGPQNGAQYGAPFVDEEWEDGELPFADEGDGEDVSNGANKPVLTEVDDSEQSQDMGVQDEIGAVSVDHGELDFNDFVDVDSLLEICKHEELGGGTHENIEVHGQQNDQDLGMNIESDAADQNQSLAILSNEFLELNDFVYSMDTNSRGDVICPEEMPNEANLVNTEVNSRKELDHVKDLFNARNENFDLSDELFLLSPAVKSDCYVELNNLSHLEPGHYSFCDPTGDEMPYVDALSQFPDADLGLPVDMNNFTDSTIATPNGPDAVAELIAYFDTTENMQSSELDLEGEADASNQSNLDPIVSGCNVQTYEVSSQPSVIDSGNSSLSLETLEAGKQSSLKSIGIHANPGAQPSNSWDKTFSKRLVSMLGGISSPPAFAAEYPMKGAKSIEHFPAAHSSSSIHVTAGMIQIRGTTASGTGKSWSALKNGDVGFVLSYSMTRSDDAGGIMPFILRNSFHLLFLSVLLLAASLKTWVYIYSR